MNFNVKESVENNQELCGKGSVVNSSRDCGPIAFSEDFTKPKSRHFFS